MEVTTKYANERGQGVCWSNLGNTLQSEERYQPPGQETAEVHAETCLINAIQNSVALLQQAISEEGARPVAPGSPSMTQLGVDHIAHSEAGSAGIELGTMEAKEKIDESRSKVDEVNKSLASRQLNLGLYYIKEHRFDEAQNYLYQAEKGLAQLLFGGLTVAQVQHEVGTQPGHMPCREPAPARTGQ